MSSGGEWHDLIGEDWAIQCHANQRRDEYWSNLALAKWTNFRVIEVEMELK